MTRKPLVTWTTAEYLAWEREQPKPSKYRNKPVTIDGIRFASQAEGDRYRELLLFQKAGEIEALKCQPRFPLVINGKTICTYVGDFYFRAEVCGITVEIVEDVKGCETQVFKIKAKLMKALHPRIDLRVTPVKSGRVSKRLRALPRTATAAKHKPPLNDLPRDC